MLPSLFCKLEMVNSLLRLYNHYHQAVEEEVVEVAVVVVEEVVALLVEVVVVVVVVVNAREPYRNRTGDTAAKRALLQPRARNPHRNGRYCNHDDLTSLLHNSQFHRSPP